MAGREPGEVALGARTEHAVWTERANDAGEVPAQLQIGEHPAVGVAEEGELVHPDELGGPGLLGAPDRRHRGTVEPAVEAPGVAIGDDAVGDGRSKRGERRNGAGRGE